MTTAPLQRDNVIKVDVLACNFSATPMASNVRFGSDFKHPSPDAFDINYGGFFSRPSLVFSNGRFGSFLFQISLIEPAVPFSENLPMGT